MQNAKTLCLLLIATIFTCTSCYNAKSKYSSSVNNSDTPSSQDKSHRHWTIAELSDSLAKIDAKELIFMRENSMQGTYVEVGKGSQFIRKAENDDLYYLHSGSCMVQHDNDKKTYKKGDIIYVKKGSKLSIEKGDEALQLVIVSMFLTSNSAKPMWKHFSKKSMVSTRDTDENVWNPFIMYSNVMLGLYMLPQNLDGDQRLVHEWQEFNILTSGSSKFIMDSGTIEVEEGSLFFVDEANGHYFDELDDDIDILILWEMRNVDHSKH